MAAFERTPRVHPLTLQQQVERQLTVMCANLGCIAIEARALWAAGDTTVIAEAVAGAAEGDVMRLKRIPRPEPVK